jgi:CRISPR-associated exonuclease Cas4
VLTVNGMLGDIDIRRMIEKTIDKIYDDFQNVDKRNPDRIHALEVSRCTRLSYYERKDPLRDDETARMSILLKDSIRRTFNNIRGEYKVDNLILEVNADMVINEEFILRFEVVANLPEIPHPRDLLYLNACLFAFNKSDGIIMYINLEGKTIGFSVTKNNRMFEEIIRRTRVLNTLLRESKVPIVEPSDQCITCKYYQRCYYREKKTSNFSLETLLGLGKKGND